MADRREFLRQGGIAALGTLPLPASSRPVSLFLCGDVMTGRGIDQVLPHPSNPRIYESYMNSALGYVKLAEDVHGPIPRRAGFSYIWGDALEELARAAPDIRIVNLETSITTSDSKMPKGINYRMHPDNVACITAAGIDCAVLANNHVLDWGQPGLAQTLETLRKAGVKTAGAGRSLAETHSPAILETPANARVLVFAYGTPGSGVPGDWAATDRRPGVAFLPDFSEQAVRRIARDVNAAKHPRDIAVVSIHWGGNWGYAIPREHQECAHRLLDEAAVDIVHGHSSHHPKGIEVYSNKPILFGCGDFLNDYEGIGGYEEFRSELALMYLLRFDVSSRRLARLEMKPFEIRRFRLQRASRENAQWLANTLTREGRSLHTSLRCNPDNTLVLEWR